MSLPVTVTITGMDKPEILRQNLRIAQNFQPMSAAGNETTARPRKESRGRRAFRALQDVDQIRQPEARLAHGFPVDMQSDETKETVLEAQNNGHPYPQIS